VTTHTYDAFDRLGSVTDRFGEKLVYTYDANGNRATLADPDDKVTRYTYDALNRTTSVTVAGAGVTNYEYFRDSRLKRVTYPNATVASSTYDAAGRVATMDNRLSPSVAQPLSAFTYTYDKNGNRTRQVETRGAVAETTDYGYDDADRLLEVTYPDKKVNYTYDGVGNRLTETTRATAGTVLSEKTFIYDVRDRLQSVDDAQNPSLDTTFGYDLNGNQIGLFLSEDPFAGEVNTPPSLHRYLYAYVNPMVYWDPDGQQFKGTKKPEEKPFFAQDRARVLTDPKEKAPAGWTVTTLGDGTRLATPPKPPAPPKPEEEEESGIVDWVLGFFKVGETKQNAERTIEEGKKLNQNLDEGTHRSCRVDEEALVERESIRTLGDVNGGLPHVGETTRQAGETAKAAGRTAASAEEGVSRATLVGGVLGALKRKLLRSLFEEGVEEVAEEAVEQTAKTAAREGVEQGAKKATKGALGKLIKVDKPDLAADALAERLGGQSRVRFELDPKGREFDAVSDLYVAQTKPENFVLGSSFPELAKATFEKALATGRTPYFHFENPPSADVMRKLAEYAERYGVKPVIDLKPLR
jgi:YD repeat-containing protein